MKLKSRKFWVAIVGALVSVIQSTAGIDIWHIVVWLIPLCIWIIIVDSHESAVRLRTIDY